MKIEYYHASKYGNGARIADAFKQEMSAKAITVNIHHVKDIKPKDVPVADLYIFSSPGRFGKPIGDMQHFLKKLELTPGNKYAVLVTELCPNPGTKQVEPNEEELGKCQRVIPVINQILHEKGLGKIAEGKIYVTGLKGPLEEDWQSKVKEFISLIPVLSNSIEDKKYSPAVT